MKSPLLITLLLALGGCAASYTEPTLPGDHPANSSAMEAPPPTRWRTLDLAAADRVTHASASAGMEHASAGHGTANTPASQPTPAGPEGAGHKHDAPPPTAEAAVMYACPMHPEVTSDKPDQRCPKCGMKLKPVPKSGEQR